MLKNYRETVLKIFKLFIFIILFSSSSFAANIVFSDKNDLTMDNTFIEDFNDEFAIEDEKEEDFDPLETYNRFMTNVNDTTYVYLLNPLAVGYEFITNEMIRDSISNVINNLQFPIRFVNNLLQLKFEETAIELSRFLINSILGIGGIFDVAKTEFNLDQKNEDFGQTLGHYGVGEGFHVVLPLLGPSNLRDIVGFSVDSISNPLSISYNETVKFKIPNNAAEELALTTFKTINSLPDKMDQYNAIKSGSIDIYPILKEFYNKKREIEIAK